MKFESRRYTYSTAMCQIISCPPQEEIEYKACVKSNCAVTSMVAAYHIQILGSNQIVFSVS